MKFNARLSQAGQLRSRPAWGAWIEIDISRRRKRKTESRPAWGAWIEITGFVITPARIGVAPRVGRVD